MADEKIIQVAPPITAVNNQSVKTDKTKLRIVKWLTFEDKDLQDLIFSTSTLLCFPMFSTSVLISGEGLARLLLVPYVLAWIVVFCTVLWLVKQFPDLQPLVWGRLLVMVIGALLGGIL
jgi:hypothetical protein